MRQLDGNCTNIIDGCHFVAPFASVCFLHCLRIQIQHKYTHLKLIFHAICQSKLKEFIDWGKYSLSKIYSRIIKQSK